MVSEIYSVRMFTPKELQNMKVPFIEDSIYLNIAGPFKRFIFPTFLINLWKLVNSAERKQNTK